MGYIADRYRRTTLGSRRAGDDRKTAAKHGFQKSVDPLGVVFKDQPHAGDPGTQTAAYLTLQKKKKREQAVGMKKGGKVPCCRGMGAATRGGKFSKNG